MLQILIHFYYNLILRMFNHQYDFFLWRESYLEMFKNFQTHKNFVFFIIDISFTCTLIQEHRSKWPKGFCFFLI